MLPDPYGSPDDYDVVMGRYQSTVPEDDADVLLQRQEDEQEHDWWCSTEPPAEDLLEVLRRAG